MSPGTCAPASKRIASPKESPSCAAAVLDRLELVEQPPESVAIDFDPASTHQVKAVGCGEQLPNLRLGQRFAIEADAHLEVEERLRANARRRLASDRGGDLRTWWTICTPGGRNSNDDAGSLEAGRISQQLKSLRGRPPQRVIDLSRLDHRLQPRTFGSGALDRQEQRKQLRLVGSACVFAQRAAERQVLRLGLRRESGRISRQKREWRLIVPPVLGKIEMHAADEMPCGISPVKKRLDRHLRFGELGSKRCRGLSPECFENRSREVLRADHRRRGCHECFELVERGRGDDRVVGREIGMGADGRDQPRAEVAPVAQVYRERCPNLAGAELEQSVTRTATEGGFKPVHQRTRQRERVFLNGEQQVAPRGQRKRRHCRWLD